MVMKMNKSEFLKKLSEVSKYDMDKCEKINEIIEKTGFIGKNNKEKIINSLVEKLNIKAEEAEDIYEKTMEIIANGVKDKIKHPFKDKD